MLEAAICGLTGSSLKNTRLLLKIKTKMNGSLGFT